MNFTLKPISMLVLFHAMSPKERSDTFSASFTDAGHDMMPLVTSGGRDRSLVTRTHVS